MSLYRISYLPKSLASFAIPPSYFWDLLPLGPSTTTPRRATLLALLRARKDLLGLRLIWVNLQEWVVGTRLIINNWVHHNRSLMSHLYRQEHFNHATKSLSAKRSFDLAMVLLFFGHASDVDLLNCQHQNSHDSSAPDEGSQC